MTASERKDLLDPVLLADVMVAEEFDDQPVVRREFLGVAADPIAERLDEITQRAAQKRLS